MSEIIFMRDDGDDGLELTAINDQNAIAYIRADLAEHINIQEKRNLFVDGAEQDESMRTPCNTCVHHDGDEFTYPCAACMHICG